MADFEFDALREECITVAGLLCQRSAGEQNAYLLKHALAQLGVHFGIVHRAVNADPRAKEPQPVGTGDAAPKAALFAVLAQELQPYRKSGAAGLEREVRDLLASLEEWLGELGETVEVVDSQVQRLRDKVADLTKSRGGGKPAAAAPAGVNGHARHVTWTGRPPLGEGQLEKAFEMAGHRRAPRRAAPATSGDQRQGKWRMLASLAAFHPGVMTRAQVAGFAKMTASGGSFSAAWAELKRENLIQEVSSGLFRCTEAGLAKLGNERPEVPRTLEERVAFWMDRLSSTEQRMLREIADRPERGLTRPQLAAFVRMTHTGGAFSAAVGTLTRNNLVQKKGHQLVLSSWLKDGPEVAHAHP